MQESLELATSEQTVDATSQGSPLHTDVFADPQSYLVFLQGYPEFKEQFRCLTCKKIFISRPSLTSHMRQMHKTEPLFVCSDCPFVAHKSREYKRHCFNSHGIKEPFVCLMVQCGETFPMYARLLKHVRDYHLRIGR